ncbi:DUF4826 family protein [bacterium]|nr:DUF4826 family protein [bacterium]
MDGEAFSRESAWYGELRDRALDFLERCGIMGCRIDDVPAWHLYPLFCIWAVENTRLRDTTIWWVVCGDLPTDLVPADLIRNPRDAMRAMGARWLDKVSCLKKGVEHPSVRIDVPEVPEGSVPYLERRAEFLISWADDDTCWDLEYDYFTY